MRYFAKKLIVFLIRKRLGLKKFERFMFNNQKSHAEYWFTSTRILKCENGITSRSGVSLNWLLSDSCEIHKVL